MARIRTIKPEFPQSESMGNVSREARLLFILLWPLCDDHGKARGSSRLLASLLYPYDKDVPDLIDDWFDELVREGCVIRYEVAGAQYVKVAKWLEHQKIDRPSASKFPDPDEGSIIVARPRERSSWDQGSRIKEGTKDRDQGPGPVSSSTGPDRPTLEHEPAAPAGADAPRESEGAEPGLPLEPSQTRESQVIDAWNAAADIVNEELGHTEWSRVIRPTPERKQLIKKLLKVHSIEDVDRALDHAMSDPWARGETQRSADHVSWRFNFDYFAKLEKFTRFLEAPKNGATQRRPPLPTTGRMAALAAVRERLRRKENLA
ncbi:hypothetical protein [Reyranella sp.]|jgi:hypothetical protein|uniref:hypothetical protein n=1 Tax=Reyranella sp. TaxID=1929291 RepID=UPI000BD6EF34|nr:hypothetical protein [Reyranella sp.]OYY35573.1 MAG: hypothetical protein B7Y57_25680 [Rhodospirillales bacterium 35-66-84]OYZ91443.1 MAG: hypothetical protein B7Y08_25550 [Rhodospirillales bacterium 24-66-33]OZB21980.1 MAG: hypothetical protein B7X63_24475 [Rhodospirillales bacterium 39-66-50]HQS15006.1 hypothetical protein [Reyranella sp.]HQT10815.1 hypothetical protein [Reyranella sp.]